MMFIADMAPSPTAGDWAYNAKFYIELAIAAFVAFAYFNGKDKAKKTAIEPQPLVIKPADEFVSMAEFRQHLANATLQQAQNQNDHAGLHSKIGGVERNLRIEFKEGMDGVRNELADDFRDLDKKVNGIASNLSAVSQQGEAHGQQLAEMRHDIKELLQRHS